MTHCEHYFPSERYCMKTGDTCTHENKHDCYTWRREAYQLGKLQTRPRGEFVVEGIGACTVDVIVRLNEDMQPVQDGNARRGL